MVATNAFGLGIDKADLRFVLHDQMPSGLDAYYQGQRVAAQNRQGRLRLLRPGLDAPALPALAQAYEDRRAQDRAQLEQMVFYGQTGWCRWKVLLEHFAAVPAGFDGCGHCDNCVRRAQHGAPHAVQAQQEAQACAEPRSTGAARGAAAQTAWRVGETIRVRRSGLGVVAAADSLQVDVAFPDGERRCYLPEWVSRVKERSAG